MNITDLQSALNNSNVQAFLHAIRLGEGTGDEGGYNRLVGGGSFEDMSTHPNMRVWIDAYQIWSTAAGAYQIIHRTWQSLVDQYHFEDFTPPWQDAMAVALIAGRGALDDVISGNLHNAVGACSNEWASLPGSTSGQRQEEFLKVQECYLANGGALSETVETDPRDDNEKVVT